MMQGNLMIRILVSLGIALPMAVWAQPADGGSSKPLRLAIAGLAHGHVSGFLANVMRRKDVQLVGVFDPVAALGKSYAEKRQNGFSPDLLYTDLGKMLDTVKPEAVATFTSTFD